MQSNENTSGNIIVDTNTNTDADITNNITTIKANDFDIKFRFGYELSEIVGFNHRSGWINVIKEIQKINNMNSNNEILFFDFIEKTFGWDQHVDKINNPIKEISYGGKKYMVPIENVKDHKGSHVVKINNIILKWYNNKWNQYSMPIDEYDKLKTIDLIEINVPWIGVWHNPPNMPSWFDYQLSPQCMIKNKLFSENINKCKGIIVLSEYMANWVKINIPSTIPVSVLYHPTDSSTVKFSFDEFINNDKKHVIQIGYWLKKLCAIGQLKTTMYKKIWLYGAPNAFNFVKKENKIHKNDNCGCSRMNDVKKLRVSNSEYDILLSKNICFLYLYDSSANNAVIECIARNTPLLINKHPAVIEYLGKDYPFYYESMIEAEKKLHDFELIKTTSMFIQNNLESQSKISYERFIRDFKNCDVIKNCLCSDKNIIN
jgi:hypothetical protein